MHVLLSLSALDKRMLGGNIEGASWEELKHSQRAVSLFNHVIANPIRDSERDAIFATATLLNTIFFASVETSDPWTSWPMKDAAISAVQWLRLQAGVALTILAANPTRPGGLFAELFRYVKGGPPDITADTAAAITKIPILLRGLFDIDESSSAENNPYLSGIDFLVPLFSIECVGNNIMYFLPFIGYMDKRLILLLEEKDLRALLLLGIWYGLTRHCDQWWLMRRAEVEYHSIELYLNFVGALTPSAILPMILV